MFHDEYFTILKSFAWGNLALSAFSKMNNQQYILYLYLAGQELGTCRDQAFKLSLFNLKHKQVWRSVSAHNAIVCLLC